MTTALPVDSLLFLASCAPPLSVVALFPGSVAKIRCSDVKSVVEASFVKELDLELVSTSVVDSGFLVDIFLKGAVLVESFCFINSVVTLLFVLRFELSVVLTCEDTVVVRRVSLLFTVEALVEVVVSPPVVDSGFLVDTFIKGAVLVESFCFINSVVTLLFVLRFELSVVLTCEDTVVVRRVSLLFTAEALVEVVVTAVYERCPINSRYRMLLLFFNVKLVMGGYSTSRLF